MSVLDVTGCLVDFGSCLDGVLFTKNGGAKRELHSRIATEGDASVGLVIDEWNVVEHNVAQIHSHETEIVESEGDGGLSFGIERHVELARHGIAIAVEHGGAGFVNLAYERRFVVLFFAQADIEFALIGACHLFGQVACHVALVADVDGHRVVGIVKSAHVPDNFDVDERMSVLDVAGLFLYLGSCLDGVLFAKDGGAERKLDGRVLAEGDAAGSLVELERYVVEHDVAQIHSHEAEVVESEGDGGLSVGIERHVEGSGHGIAVFIDNLVAFGVGGVYEC